MIALPSNVTTAALALLLGVLIGAGGTYYFTSSEPTSSEGVAQFDRMEGQGVLERMRRLAPSDTAGQDEADVEIRYKTRVDTVRDSVRVPVPTSLPSMPMLSDRTPIEVTADRVTWSYYDPSDDRWEQRLYSVPTDRWELSAYATARARMAGLSRPERVWVGPALRLRYRRLSAHVSALTTPLLKRQRVFFGLRYKL